MRVIIKNLQDEQQSLLERKTRLSNCLKSPEGLSMSPYHRNLMVMQLRSMEQVLDVLKLRMDDIR
ncbi:MAG: crAss001_48 related protein, partial [Bacteroidales bacterium]